MSSSRGSADDGLRLQLPDSMRQKYFAGMSAIQMAVVVEQALEVWFSGKEAPVFSSEDLKCLDLHIFPS